MDKEKMLEQFERCLVMEGVKPTTYIKVMKVLFNKVKDFTEENVVDYLLRTAYKPNTFNQMVKVLGRWNKCFDLGWTLPKPRKQVKKLPAYLDWDWFRKEVINRLPWIFPKTHKKVKAILMFMFFTGVRKSELLALKREDILLSEKKAIIYEKKKNKQRVVFFTEKVAEALIEYFQYEEEKFNAFNINESGFNAIFRRLREQFPEKADKLHPHALRHSFAVHSVRKGVPITAIKEMLGHSKIDTTLIYTEVDNELMESFYRRYIR